MEGRTKGPFHHRLKELGAKLQQTSVTFTDKVVHGILGIIHGRSKEALRGVSIFAYGHVSDILHDGHRR